jgi:hypothetical protein
VRVFKDGAVAFHGGPFVGSRANSGMVAGGTLLVGQMAAAACSGTSCALTAGSGLVGKLQNVRVWNRLLSSTDVLHGIKWPFKGSSTGLTVNWRFEKTAAYMPSSAAFVIDASGQGVGAKTAGNQGTLSPVGASIVDDTPSLNPNTPCGKVYSNTWHFGAPAAYRGDLSAAYGGRLQWSMHSPTHNGRARARRGTLALFGGDVEISAPLSLFALPTTTGFTSYSAVLREDYGWVTEPANEPVTGLVMKAVMANVTAVLIRGDGWVYDASGPGQEITYLNNVQLLAKA